MNRMFTLPRVQARGFCLLYFCLLTVLSAAGSLRAQQPAKAGLKGNIAYYPTPGVVEIHPNEILFETPDGRVGLRGEYFANANLNGKPAFTRRDRQPRFNWKKGRPKDEGDATLPEDGFSVRWTGRLAEVRRTDKYRFHFTGDGLRVWVNGQKLVNAWEKGGDIHEDITLEKGTSPKIRIEYRHQKGKAQFKCHVRPLGAFQEQMLHTPEGNPGVKVEWFGGNKLEGKPGSERTMPRISYGQFRAPGVQSKTYSGRWITVFGPAPASGTYLFHFISSDGLRVWVNGLKRFEDWTTGKVKHTARVELQEGEKVGLRAEMYHKPHGVPVMKMTPRIALDSLAAWRTRGTLAILNEAGEQVQEKECAWNRFGDRFFVDIDELEPGMHTVRLSGEAYNNSLGKKVYHNDYPWEGNDLGITDKIYKPFKPIRVNGQTVEVVRRRYHLNALGLPAQIEADDQEEEADYRELLADPVTITVNGETLSGQDGMFSETTARKAVYEGNASHPAVRLTTRTETEFDGCMRVEMTLQPGGQKEPLKSMTLDIPMRNSMAPLFHVVKGCTPIRNNPAGSTPDGTGQIWRSAEMRDRKWPGNFKPYLYLGGPERGLSWFADNEKGWVMDWTTTPSCQTLHRTDGKLTLRLHLAQKPTVIKEPRRITFGLMASPAKPMPQNWRKVGQPGGKEIMFRMGHLFGRNAVFAAKYPRGKDYSPFAKFHAQRKGEKVDIKGFVEEWAEKHLHDEMTDNLQKRFKGLMRNILRAGNGLGSDTYFTSYFDEFRKTVIWHEEMKTYWSEWVRTFETPWGPLYDEWSNRPTKKDHLRWSRPTGSVVKSYRDFACYFAKKQLENGVGIYFDNTFLQPAYNLVTTNAYTRPDGTIQPSAQVWARRKYLRRIWVLHKQLYQPETPQIMMLHMTNSHVLPYMVWNQANLDLEWKVRGARPFQEKFSPDLLRAESLGRKTGTYPMGMLNPHRPEGMSEQRFEFIQRTHRAGLYVHEIKYSPHIRTSAAPEPLVEFGYGDPDCDVVNYWKPDTPVSVSDDQCKWILLRRDGEALIMLVTWNDEEQTVNVDIDTDALDIDVAQATNAESGQTMPAPDGDFAFTMPGYGIRIYRLK